MLNHLLHCPNFNDKESLLNEENEDYDDERDEMENNIEKFIQSPPLSKNQIETFHNLISKVTCKMNLPLRWVDDPCVHEFIKFLNPNAESVFPSRKTLSNCLIPSYDKFLMESSLVGIKLAKGITLEIDSWKDTSNNKILGAVMIGSNGKSFVVQVFS